MPKVKSCCSNQLRGFVKKFGEHLWFTYGLILYANYTMLRSIANGSVLL